MRVDVIVNMFGSWPKYWGANPPSALCVINCKNNKKAIA